MSVQLSPLPIQRFYDNNNNPLSGGQLYTYQAGTTTPIATYTDSTGNTQNTNPIVLNARGECSIWMALGQAYKLVLQDAAGNAIWTQDQVGAFGPVGSGPSIGATVTNIAGLRALAKNSFAAVNVLGYSAAGDGGGGTYYYDSSDTTSADNGGTIIVASDGGRWKLEVNGQVSVLQFGAKGDGATDDTAAIQAALNSSKSILFPAGKTFYSATGLTVPVSCPGIYGEGATLKGPGSTGTVDGFTFNGWYSGGGSVASAVVGAHYYLPSINTFRYGINNTIASWVYVQCDLIKNCSAGIATFTTAGNYSVENDYQIGMILQCNYGLYESVPNNTGAGTEGLQGCRFNVFYLAGCNYGIYRNIVSGSVSTFNEYYIVELDGNGASSGTANAYALYNSAQSTKVVANKYRIPTGPINCNASPSAFHFGELNSVYEMLYFQGMDPTPYAFGNFLAAGPITTVAAANGTLYVYVATTGNDTTGDGSSGNPFATITKAATYIQSMDHRGNAAVIQLAAGTYSIGLNHNLDQAPDPNVRLYLRGQTNASQVTITGGVNASGANARLTVEYVTITTSGISANNNAYVDFDNCIFGAMTNSQNLLAQNGARIVASGPYTISGSAISHASAQYDGRVFLDGNTVTLQNTPAFSSAFAYAAKGLVSAQTMTFSGTATGTRYNAVLNGVVNTNGGGATYLPGSVAGGTSTGGQYN